MLFQPLLANVQVITEVEPLVAYILSMWDSLEATEEDKLSDLHTYLDDVIRQHGNVFITKSQGLVIATK